MFNAEELRPAGQDPRAFKEDLHEAALILGLHYVRLYREAGCPYGTSVDGMLLWMRHRRLARTN